MCFPSKVRALRLPEEDIRAIMSISEEAGNHLQGNGSRTIDVQNIRSHHGTRGTIESQAFDNCLIGGKEEVEPGGNEGKDSKHEAVYENSDDREDEISEKANAEPCPTGIARGGRQEKMNSLLSYTTTNTTVGTSTDNGKYNNNCDGRSNAQSQPSNHNLSFANHKPKSTDLSTSLDLNRERVLPSTTPPTSLPLLPPSTLPGSPRTPTSSASKAPI